jgi:hypothetical protein
MNIKGFDILDAIDIQEDPCEFKPTDRQISFKIRLLKTVSPAVLSKLSADSLHIIKTQVAPFSIDRVREWIEDNPCFLEWCLLTDISEVKLYKAKQTAIDTIIEIMSLSETDEKTMALRLKAAEAILKTEKVTTKTVNNLKMPMLGVPKDLQNKPVEALQAELTRLQG